MWTKWFFNEGRALSKKAQLAKFKTSYFCYVIGLTNKAESTIYALYWIWINAQLVFDRLFVKQNNGFKHKIQWENIYKNCYCLRLQSKWMFVIYYPTACILKLELYYKNRLLWFTANPRWFVPNTPTFEKRGRLTTKHLFSSTLGNDEGKEHERTDKSTAATVIMSSACNQ